jgi:hypothetical protein
LSGVEIRNNLGKGVWIPNESVVTYTITGCHFVDNGQGMNVVGSDFLITSNICSGNGAQNQITGPGLVQNNLNC